MNTFISEMTEKFPFFSAFQYPRKRKSKETPENPENPRKSRKFPKIFRIPKFLGYFRDKENSRIFLPENSRNLIVMTFFLSFGIFMFV